MYDFEKAIISDLDEFEFRTGDFHYIYRDFDFLYKHQPGKKKLVVFFHGAGKEGETVFFRGFNYNFKDADILSLSDNLLKRHSKDGLLLSWFLSTPGFDNTAVYKEILGRITRNYRKVVFSGTSGGGFPALYFSSFFGKTCLISNSQIYLDRYSYFVEMLKILKTSGKQIDYDIERSILKSPPRRIHLYTNVSDTHHYEVHSLPFKRFMEKHFPDRIECIFFKGRDPAPGTTNHHVQFPEADYQTALVRSLRASSPPQPSPPSRGKGWFSRMKSRWRRWVGGAGKRG